MEGDQPMSTVFVDIYQASKPWRQRKWRWKATNAGNHEIMASGQAYMREGDAIDAVQQLFGDISNVYLRREEKGNAVLRYTPEIERDRLIALLQPELEGKADDMADRIMASWAGK